MTTDPWAGHNPPPVLTRYAPSGYPQPPAAEANLTVLRPPNHPTRATNGRRTTRPTRRRARLIASVVAAILIAATAARYSGLGVTESPNDVVKAVFDALTARDGDRLHQAAACGTGTSSPLCTSTGLSTGYQPPQNVRLRTTPAARTSEHNITATYTVNGAEHTQTITLSRHRIGLLGHGWSIVTDIGSQIDLRSATKPDIRIAGISVDVAGSPGVPATETIWAPPGTYDVSADGDAIFQPIRTTVHVTGATTPVAAQLNPIIRPDLQTNVEQQIRARLDACAAQRDLKPDIDPGPLTPGDCPFRHETRYTLTDQPTWTIDSYPAVKLTTEAGAVAVATTSPGTATVTYRWTTDIVEPRRWNTVNATEPITVGGHVTIDNGVPSWKP